MDLTSMLGAYKTVFESPHGAIVLEDLKKAHFIYAPTAGTPIDPLAIAYNEGQRNVILRIMALLETKEENHGRTSLNTDPSRINAAADGLFTADECYYTRPRG